jgi:glycosyltransferase involved in cell wall biosynthesis
VGVRDVAGQGPSDYVAELKSRAASKGLQQQIRWHGHVSGDAKLQLFYSSDIFVLPSHSENFGIAVLEAMACGMPCVVGRGVALANRMVEAEAGVAVDTCAEAIAAGIERYLDSPADREHAGRAARMLVEREFSIEMMSQRLVSLYETVRNPGRTSGATSQDG